MRKRIKKYYFHILWPMHTGCQWRCQPKMMIFAWYQEFIDFSMVLWPKYKVFNFPLTIFNVIILMKNRNVFFRFSWCCKFHEVHNHECNILFIWLRLFNWVLVFVLFKIETFFDFFSSNILTREREKKKWYKAKKRSAINSNKSLWIGYLTVSILFYCPQFIALKSQQKNNS